MSLFSIFIVSKKNVYQFICMSYTLVSKDHKIPGVKKLENRGQHKKTPKSQHLFFESLQWKENTLRQ